MDKKEIAGIRKELKNDSTVLQVDDIYYVYLKSDNQEVVHSDYKYFHQVETEMQEMHLTNFRKVLTGAFDTKVFELDFDNAIENDTQSLLDNAVNASKDDFISSCEELLKKIKADFMYDSDVFVSFMRAEYIKGAKRRSRKMVESEEAVDDAVTPYKFIICSINKIEPQKKALKFDFRNKELTTNSAVDIVINTKSPLDGFMYPSLTDNMADVNKIIYYGSKPKDLNMVLIENVLGCISKETADSEKDRFTGVLKTVIGESVNAEVMQKIYSQLNDKIAEYEESENGEEVPVIGAKELKSILTSSGAELKSSDVASAFGEMAGDDRYQFKIENIVPKSIKIHNSGASVTISPGDLDNIKQIRDKNGNKCLLIKLDEDVLIEGFTLKTEDEE